MLIYLFQVRSAVSSQAESTGQRKVPLMVRKMEDVASGKTQSNDLFNFSICRQTSRRPIGL